MNFDGLSGQAAAARLEEVIHKNLPGAQREVQRVFSQMPVDRKAPAELVTWEVQADGTVEMVADDAGVRLPMHNHALGHVYGISGVPANFSNKLREVGEEWSRDLLAHNLNELWSRLRDRDGRPPAHLVRSTQSPRDTRFDELGMAVLSSSYKTIDTRPLLETFLEQSTALGAVPYHARGTDLQFAMKVIIPKVQIVNGDPYVFGLEYRNTDWGGTAAGLTAFLLRLACMNGMTTEKVFRKVHLGAKLDRDSDWSQKTRLLERDTTISAIADVTKGFLLPERQESLGAQLRAASEKEVSIDKIESTLKGKIPAGQVKRTIEVIQSADPRVPRTLGSKISWLDAAQAVSAISQDVEVTGAADAEIGNTVLDMERIAGSLMNLAVA